MSNLSFQISEPLVRELRELSQSAAKCQQTIEATPTDELNYIHRNVRVSMIGASTRIENAILTDAEVDWVDTTLSKKGNSTASHKQIAAIQNKLSKDKERSIDEVSGCRAMLHLIYSQAKELFPLTETTIRGLHAELLRYCLPAEHYRGRYKIVSNSVVQRNQATGEETSILKTSDPGPITESAMQNLIRWYNEALPNQAWTIAVATEFVFRFLAIHPFQDGNGRIGRGLFLLALLQSPDASLQVVAPYLPIDRHIERQREDYYTVLRRCSNGAFQPDSTSYEYEHFLRFMIQVVSISLNDFTFYQERYQALNQLSPSALKVLECFKERPENRLQTKDIVTNTSIPRPTVSDALKVLVDRKFIQRLGRGAGAKYQLVF